MWSRLALALKLLFDASSTIYIPGSLLTTLHVCIIRKPIPLGVKSACMFASGPLTGIAAHYAVVKIEAIINELIDNKKVSYKKRIIKGIKKPFYSVFTRPNNIVTLIATFYGLYLHFSQFIPTIEPLPSNLANEYNQGVAFTDGYGILKSLGYY